MIEKLGERIEAALIAELNKSHSAENAERVKDQLLALIPVLHNLSVKHVFILNRFKQQYPEIEFPALHKELFSPEGMDAQLS